MDYSLRDYEDTPPFLGGAGGGPSSSDSSHLLRQNSDLQRKLDEESASNRKKLDAYRTSQQQQAALVSKLQAKLLQYKQRCKDLERDPPPPLPSYLDVGRGGPTSSSALDAAQAHLRELREERIQDFDTALRRLEDERRENDKLRKMNAVYKEQLDEAHQTNEALTNDLEKLTSDWTHLREDMAMKEKDWIEEEQYFNDYYSSEHARLLALWRDVVDIKRSFSAMQAATEQDLTKIRTDLGQSTRQMNGACTSLVAMGAGSGLANTEKEKLSKENSELKSQVSTLKSDNHALALDSKHKEEKVEELLKRIHVLESRVEEADQNVLLVEEMQHELELLQNTLRDIARAVIQDAEGKDVISSVMQPHVHLTQPGVPPRSPKRAPFTRQPTSPAFAEGTISAVQSSLNNYQLHIHELQTKLAAHREQLHSMKKQYETADESQYTLSQQVNSLTTELDQTKSALNQANREKEGLNKNIEILRVEKTALEKTKREINEMVESLNSNLDKVQKNNSRLSKINESLQNEKLFLQNELDRINSDMDNRETELRGKDDMNRRLREDLLIANEDLKNAKLAKELLEQNKEEMETLLGHVEKSKGDLESEMERLLLDQSEMNEQISKCEALIASLEADRRSLCEKNKKCEEEKQSLRNQMNDQGNDVASLKKELLQAEQIRLDLDSEKLTLIEKCKFLEMEKEKVEVELSQVTKDRSDLSHQLSLLQRKKENLVEDISRLKQKYEQSLEMNNRVNKNLEDLVKECEEKEITIEANDKELQRLQEQLASLRSDKESLEAILFDTQSHLEQSEVKKEQLEHDVQELLVKQESLKGQVVRLTKDLEDSEKRSQDTKASLVQQASSLDAEYQNQISNLKKQNEESVAKLTEEKEQVRNSLEKKLHSTVKQLTEERECELNKMQINLSQLQSHIDKICQQHEDALLRAENDKQQALLIAQQDQKAIQDKLGQVLKELEEEKCNLDRIRREAAGRGEQDRNTINTLREQLNRTVAKLEDLKTRTEEEKNILDKRIAEMKCEREGLVRESEDIKVHLNLCEDKVDTLTSQLSETARRLKEAENIGDALRKELLDTKTHLADTNFEKDKYAKSNKDLREMVKRVESEKRDHARTIEEGLQKIASLEEARNQLEIERAKLLTQCREVERSLLSSEKHAQTLTEELHNVSAQNAQKSNEEKEMAARLMVVTEERDKAGQDLHVIRKQIVDIEANYDLAQQEIQRLRQRGDEEEERWRAREQDLMVTLEGLRNKQRNLEDQKHNLEVCLADATQQIKELKARLGGAEERVRASSAHLLQLEASKKDVEHKLSSIGSTLRRIAGIQLDGRVGGGAGGKMTSPARRYSPVRGPDGGDGMVDVDPEAVRKGVRNLMQQVAQIERERDDLKAMTQALKREIKDLSDAHGQESNKMAAAQQNMRALQEEKYALEVKLSQSKAACSSQTEAMDQKSEELQHLREKVMSLELALSNVTEEKSQGDDKLMKCREGGARLEAEKRALQDELSRTEGRVTKLELQRVALEGDQQRLQMLMQEKEANLFKLQERCEHQCRNITGLEERCSSLKTTIDQLNLTLERASAGETELRGEIATLQRNLMDTSLNSQSNCDKLKQLQKLLHGSENEKRVFQERLDTCQASLAELRRCNMSQCDQLSRLQNEIELKEVARASLESQLRMAQWPSESPLSGAGDSEEVSKLVRERSELRNKLDNLHDKVRQLESDKRTLERKSRSRSYERGGGADKGYSTVGNTLYESKALDSDVSMSCPHHDYAQIKQRCRRLEQQLGEKEGELSRLKAQFDAYKAMDCQTDRSSDLERYRAAQLHAESLLEAREKSHRQQVNRLENQIQMLREQLNSEIKRRQLYIYRDTRAGKEMQQLRQALGDSLRTVAQDPSVDALLLEHEANKLDTTALSASTNSSSMPLALPPPRSYRK
uniref:Rootletin n=1 Tax=Cacopsylla melanoneura TaxID=428564 RepID=A0A8D8VW00_9HEMI